MTGCSVVSSNSVEIAPEIIVKWGYTNMVKGMSTFKVAYIPRILYNRDLEAETNAEVRYFVLSRAFCSEDHSPRATLTKSARHENSSVFLLSTLPFINVSGRTEPQPPPSKRHDIRQHFPGHM